MTPSRTLARILRPGAVILVGTTLGLMTGGCTIASVTTVGADADITRAVLARDLIRDLEIDEVGSGPITWAKRSGEPGPASPMQVVDRMLEPTEGVTEVLHRDKDTNDVAEVAVRPAWTTRLDNRSSSTPMTSSIADEVTISYVQPGSPGQHGEGQDHPKIDIDVTVEVAPGECSDVVALQVWQLDDPEVAGNGATVAAIYLGSEVVTMPCPA